jgi:hypothetical protein
VFHSNTQGLIDHWRALREGDEAPAREALDPAAISEILTQVFLVGRDTPALPFRLAGGMLTDLHGKSLRGDAFLDLWADQSRGAARDSALSAVRDREPVVIYADAPAAGGSLELEIMLAPLSGPGGALDRLLGIYQPLQSLAVVRGETIGPLSHRFAVRLGAAPRERPALRLAALDGVRL